MVRREETVTKEARETHQATYILKWVSCEVRIFITPIIFTGLKMENTLPVKRLEAAK